ncbi:MAG: M48 family metallopeptidase [Aureispira sp.]
MKGSYYVLLFCLLYSLLPLHAQDFNDYQLLESTGTIPSDFLTLSSEKYQNQRDTVRQSEEVATNRDTDDFLLESNFAVDNLLRSARVLFNDPITTYVNKVADELLKNDPAMRQQLRFYAVRSAAVNAFATNQGIIFVNVGLIAQLETEAQLAFILAHEITHVRHGHALEMFLEASRIDRYSNRKKVLSEAIINEDMVAKNHYSKELETNADTEGLALFLKSNYNLEDLDGAFDVLQYSYLPFDIVSIRKEDLELEQLKLSDSLFLADEELNPIEGDYEEDDSKSTHPSIDKRRAATAKTILSHSNQGRESYLVNSKEVFERMRDVARFEVAYYYLHQMRFQDALYAVFLLQKKYPKSKYLKKIRAKALYGYTKFRNEFFYVKPYNAIYDIQEYPFFLQTTLFEEIEGPSQQIYYFLSQMAPNEVNVYALRYAWDVAQEFPADKEMETILMDLFKELAFHYEKRQEFSTVSLEEALAYANKRGKEAIEKEEEEAIPPSDTNTIEEKESKKLSKYDKIKKQQKEKVVEILVDSTLDYFRYAFSDIHADSAFKALFKIGQEYKVEYKKRRAYFRSSKGRRHLFLIQNRRYVRLGLDSILVYNPMYLEIEGGRDLQVDYLKGESAQLQLVHQLEKLSKRVNLHLQILTPNGLSTSDADAFNDLRVLAEWLSQQNKFGGNIYSDGYNQDKVEAIIKKYATPYLLFTGVVNTQKYNIKSSFLWAVVFDLRTGSYRVIKDDFYRRKAGKVILNAQFYDTLLQIKTPPKNKQTTNS